MEENDLKKIWSQITLPVGHPDQGYELFRAIAKSGEEQNVQAGRLFKACQATFEGLSRQLDLTQVQESCQVRSNLRSRRLAKILIDDQGQLKKELLPRTICYLRKFLYFLGPGYEHDRVRQRHMMRCLQQLHEDEEVQRALHKIRAPHGNSMLDGYIRATLQMPKKEVIKDCHARRAALSAWICLLRQSVGSCFATAPALIVQMEQPTLFFQDLQDLFSRGELRRTVGGSEYTAPLSQSTGLGELLRPVFLRRDFDQAIPLWSNPGLILALERAEVLGGADSLQRQVKVTKKLLKRYVDAQQTEQDPLQLDIDAVLQFALMEKWDLSKEDLKEYEQRQVSAMAGVSSFHIASISSDQVKSVGERCKQYLQALADARLAFRCLADNTLLKIWEYTLASFAEVKASFSTWNLYSSLGMAPNDPDGIGPRMMEAIEERLQALNAEVQEHQSACEQAYAHVKMVEARYKRARSEQDAQWLKIELQNRSGELHHYEELRDTVHHKAKVVANLYNALVDALMEAFPSHFQEVYDPEIQEVTVGPYDDSPAGFRLLYKAGRSATAAWSRVTSHQEYIESLAGFFAMVENDLAYLPQFELVQDEVRLVISRVIQHIRSESFLVSAFDRMARAHQSRPIKDPLNNLDKVEKKPWVYTSGGTMASLVASYYGREEKPAEKERWVENETELCAFLLEIAKELPAEEANRFQEQPHRSMLIHSPTHAFLFKPGEPLFEHGWLDQGYVYSWIKEACVKPGKNYLYQLKVDANARDVLLARLEHELPVQIRPAFRHHLRYMPQRLSSKDFTNHVLGICQKESALKYRGASLLSEYHLASVLFNHMPFVEGRKISDAAGRVFACLDDPKKEEYQDVLDRLIREQGTVPLVGRQELLQLLLSVVMLVEGSICSELDMQHLLLTGMREVGLAPPMPLIFADTNWTKDYFSFVVSPASGKFEFWRVDRYGNQGWPMTMWKHWVDGSHKKPTWGVYINPKEYRGGERQVAGLRI